MEKNNALKFTCSCGGPLTIATGIRGMVAICANPTDETSRMFSFPPGLTRDQILAADGNEQEAMLILGSGDALRAPDARASAG